MTRNLASIQKITDIKPIKGADFIVMAQVLGWQCVVKKDEFNIGDTVVYVEVDSIMPERPEYEFLKDRKYRIKTIKLKGQISQGLVLPISILPKSHQFERVVIGQDVTDTLGIKKYDPQEVEEKELTEKVNRVTKFLRRFAWYRKLFSVQKGGFPSWITKTDETRIQNMPNIFETHKGVLFEATEKLDGQSATYFMERKKFLFWNKYVFGVCSRKNRLGKPDGSSWWTVAKQYKIENVLRKLMNGKFDRIVLQGEIIGRGIQGNKYKINGYEFYAFNLILPNETCTASRMRSLLNRYGIPTVPLAAMGFWTLPATIDEAVKFASKNSLVNPLIPREGIVCRDGQGLSFKIINPEFLLKFGE